MKCIKCGKEYDENNKFCSVCGQNLENNNDSNSFWEEDYKNKFDNTIKINEDLLQSINEQKLFYNYDDNIEENEEIKIINNNDIEKLENVKSINNDLNDIDVDKEFYGNDFKVKKNNIWIILMVIFILLLIIFGGIYYYLSIPKNMLMFSFYKYSSKLENYFSKDYYSISGNYNIDFDSNDLTGTNQKILDVYNGLSLSGTYGVDFDRNVTTLEFGSLYKNNTLINGNIYGTNDNYYLYLDGVYDKYLMTKLNKNNSTSTNNKVTNQDYINVVNCIKNSLITSIKDEYLVKTSGTYNNKRVNKINLYINKDNYNIIATDLLTFLKDDKQFIKSINNITNKDMYDEIDTLLSNIDNYVYNNNINIDFYIKNITNDLLKLDIELKNSSGKDFVNISIEDSNIKLVYSDGSEINNINLKSYKENKTNIYELEINNKDLVMNLKLNLLINYNKTITNKDVNNNIDIEKLTNEDKQNIINNIMDKPNIQLFMSDIFKLSDNLNITNDSNIKKLD